MWSNKCNEKYVIELVVCFLFKYFECLLRQIINEWFNLEFSCILMNKRCHRRNVEWKCPLMVLRTVDRAKKFHPLVYACCSHERTLHYKFTFKYVRDAIKTHFDREFNPEVLIADAADPIRNAFYELYESAKLDIMCFAHVIRYYCKRPFTSKCKKKLILDNIRKIQWCRLRSIFRIYVHLQLTMCKKATTRR